MAFDLILPSLVVLLLQLSPGPQVALAVVHSAHIAASSLPPYSFRARCQFSRPNYSNWSCSLQNCPVLVQLSHIAPPRPQFNVSINRYYMLPMPLNQIHHSPSVHLPCFVSISSRHLHQPHIIRLPSLERVSCKWLKWSNSEYLSWSVRKVDESSTIIIVLVLASIAVFLPMALLICISSSGIFYSIYLFIRKRICPCLPEPRRPYRTDVQGNQDPLQLFYLRPEIETPQIPHNIATPESTPARTFKNAHEIDQLISSATVSETDAILLRKESWVCCICLENQGLDRDIAQLDCGHATHAQCLRLWLKKGCRQTCCLCNAPATSSIGFVKNECTISDTISSKISQTEGTCLDSEHLDDTQSASEQTSLPSLSAVYVSQPSPTERQHEQQNENSTGPYID